MMPFGPNANVPGRPTPSLQPFSVKVGEETSGSRPGAVASTVASHQGLHALLALPSSARTRQRISWPSAYRVVGIDAEKAVPVEPSAVTYSPILVPSSLYHSKRPLTELSVSFSFAHSLGALVLMIGRSSPETQGPPGSDHTSAATGAAGSELYSMTRLGLFLNFFQA